MKYRPHRGNPYASYTATGGNKEKMPQKLRKKGAKRGNINIWQKMNTISFRNSQHAQIVQEKGKNLKGKTHTM